MIILIVLDFGFIFNSKRSASTNINALINKLKDHKNGITWLLAIDRVESSDLSDLELCHDNIHVHLVIASLESKV